MRFDALLIKNLVILNLSLNNVRWGSNLKLRNPLIVLRLAIFSFLSVISVAQLIQIESLNTKSFTVYHLVINLNNQNASVHIHLAFTSNLNAGLLLFIIRY